MHFEKIENVSHHWIWLNISSYSSTWAFLTQILYSTVHVRSLPEKELVTLGVDDSLLTQSQLKCHLHRAVQSRLFSQYFQELHITVRHFMTCSTLHNLELFFALFGCPPSEWKIHERKTLIYTLRYWILSLQESL